MSRTRLLVLTKYGPLGGSSRLRSLQYLPALQSHGFDTTQAPMLSDAQLAHRYESGRYAVAELVRSYAHRLKVLLSRRQFDLVWIEKEALPWLPAWLELALLTGIPFVLDYDDAVFHTYDHHRSGLVRATLGHRLDALMARAAMVVAGNDYLAQRARAAGARRVELLPTVVDLRRYSATLLPAEPRKVGAEVCVMWMGSPTTAQYLQALEEPLRRLSDLLPVRLRVVGASGFHIQGVRVESAPWSESTEAAELAGADLGVMPLNDSPWERGKCGYKLIQYMASGLPVVASPVGVNAVIVEPGINGFLASTSQEWLGALEALTRDPALRWRMGRDGRAKVEEKYCLGVTAPLLARWLREVAQAH